MHTLISALDLYNNILCLHLTKIEINYVMHFQQTVNKYTYEVAS